MPHKRLCIKGYCFCNICTRTLIQIVPYVESFSANNIASEATVETQNATVMRRVCSQY